MQVIFPGTFDPPTNGHLDLMRRASSLFERVLVVVAVNSNKESLFSEHERLYMMESLSEEVFNVEIHLWQGLIVDFAKKENIRTLLKDKHHPLTV